MRILKEFANSGQSVTTNPDLRSVFESERAALVQRHRQGAGGIRTGLGFSLRLDALVRAVALGISHPHRKHLCVVAVGGYGRQEMSFRSDADLMILIPDGATADTGGAASEFFHNLLAQGIDLGHSVRSIGDCLDLEQSDLEAWVSVLESRYICGAKSLYASFRSRLAQQIASADHLQFTYKLLARLDQRHQKYGSSVKLLEPNIKNSAGGLRDLHTILWLARGSGLCPLPLRTREGETATVALLRSPVLTKRFEAQALREAFSALDLLLRVRNEMHLQASSLHDTLEFTFQKAVAEGLGYKSTRRQSGAERFMQEYYAAARSIAQLWSHFQGFIRSQFVVRPSTPAAERIDRRFVLREGRLALEKARAKLSNELVLEAFRHSIRRELEFSEELESRLRKGRTALTTLRSNSETELFRDLLNMPVGVAGALRRMNDLAVLERWIPDWAPMVAFFQHNRYHYYTADEHTIRVVEGAERLLKESNSFGAAFRNLPRRDVLYLACLLHDIAKPRRVSDHEIVGARMAAKILKTLRYTDALEDVQFLIRNHLLMEQVAFRRNLADPQTIVSFASRFKRPSQLEYLYVLTYADLNAVNKSVWTDWKRMLLEDLYRKTREVLERKLSSLEVHSTARERHHKAVQALIDRLTDTVSQDISRPHLEAVDSPAYLETFDAEEIAEHIRSIEKREPVSTMVKHFDAFSEITIITKDAPFLLSKCCGVLAANDANIFDAHIFTRSDGIVIDKFRVFDFVSRSCLTEAQSAKIRSELGDVLDGNINTEHLLQRHRMKWRRRTSPPPPTVRLRVAFEHHPRYTIVDIFAADTLGFLYKITELMSELGLDISFAKIATRADGIVDSFYVLDRSGQRIDDKERQAAIREELVKAVEHLARTELVLT